MKMNSESISRTVIADMDNIGPSKRSFPTIATRSPLAAITSTTTRLIQHGSSGAAAAAALPCSPNTVKRKRDNDYFNSENLNTQQANKKIYNNFNRAYADVDVENQENKPNNSNHLSTWNRNNSMDNKQCGKG